MESMKDFEKELEESYKIMGDGEKDTDMLLAWEKVGEYLESQENIEVEICSQCHPFYTGKERGSDKVGRIQKFKERAAKKTK